MISNELADELYKNGFPSLSPLPYIPTLSELIEACGNIKFILKVEYDVWIASDMYLVSTVVKPGQLLLGLIGVGDTPEEAVARLWLELNKE